MRLADTWFLIPDEKGNYRSVMDVKLVLEYIEELREKKLPDASITDRLRNELTDILIKHDAAVQSIEEKGQPQPKKEEDDAFNPQLPDEKEKKAKKGRPPKKPAEEEENNEDEDDIDEELAEIFED